MKQLSLILVGGGDRGSCYLKYLNTCPEKFRLVGIAEPVKAKRDFLRDSYNVPEENCVESYKELLSRPKFADIVMICTQDRMHFEPAMMAVEKKYHILLEKPMSITVDECYKIYKSAEANGVRGVVCHVLRYTPFYKTLKKFITDGRLGDVINIVHTEGVGNVHMSHSFVRGNWRKKEEAAPMILAKCCHDTDLLMWLTGKECVRVQSFGGLTHFCEKNKPEGAPARCTDGCPHKDTCFYYAPSLYRIDTTEVGHFRAIVANKFNPTDEEVDSALLTSPYGRCVYQCDNDVVDHQAVTLEYDNGTVATLTMSGFNKGGRDTVIMGTKGEIHANIEEEIMDFYDFATRTTTSIYDPNDLSVMGGHRGGDEGIMADLYDYIALDKPSDSTSDLRVSCMSHLACFAAEEARVNGTTVDMNEYVNSL